MVWYICSRQETNKEQLLHNERLTRHNFIKQRPAAKR
jgi:hypothetical protein